VVVEDSIEPQEWLFCINSLDKERDFSLPILHSKGQWQCQLNTGNAKVSGYNEMPIEPSFSMQARSMRIYKKTKI
jgi:isoamylase